MTGEVGNNGPRLMGLFVGCMCILVIISVLSEVTLLYHSARAGLEQSTLLKVRVALQRASISGNIDSDSDGLDDLQALQAGLINDISLERYLAGFVSVSDTDFRDPSAFLASVQSFPAVTGSLLPRTSAREYNYLEPKTKYVIYSPSGGFNNQLLCLLNAIYVAKRAGRGVIVAPFGRHSSQYFNYYKLTDLQVIPFDQAVDLGFLERATGVSLVPLNVTLRTFRTNFLRVGQSSTSRVELLKIPVEEHMRFATPAKAAKMLKISVDSSKQVIFYFGAFFNRHWIEPMLREAVRLAPYMRMFAKAQAQALFGDSPFNSFHIRLGDKMDMARSLTRKGSEVYINAARKAGAVPSTPVYVATDERKDNKYLEPLLKTYDTIFFAKDAKVLPALQSWYEDFYKRFPPSQLRSDIIGLVEMLICVRSQKFVGTSLSTFTGTISFSRKNLPAVAPDVWVQTRNAKKSELPITEEMKRVTVGIVWNGQVQEMRDDDKDSEG